MAFGKKVDTKKMYYKTPDSPDFRLIIVSDS